MDDDLTEIVQLVGRDSLNEADKVTLTVRHPPLPPPFGSSLLTCQLSFVVWLFLTSSSRLLNCWRTIFSNKTVSPNMTDTVHSTKQSGWWEILLLIMIWLFKFWKPLLLIKKLHGLMLKKLQIRVTLNSQRWSSRYVFSPLGEAPACLYLAAGLVGWLSPVGGPSFVWSTVLTLGF